MRAPGELPTPAASDVSLLPLPLQPRAAPAVEEPARSWPFGGFLFSFFFCFCFATRQAFKMMSMNSKQPHFAMHPTLPEHKYPSLHSSSEAIRRACLPTPPVRDPLPVGLPPPPSSPACPPLPSSLSLSRSLLHGVPPSCTQPRRLPGVPLPPSTLLVGIVSEQRGSRDSLPHPTLQDCFRLTFPWSAGGLDRRRECAAGGCTRCDTAGAGSEWPRLFSAASLVSLRHSLLHCPHCAVLSFPLGLPSAVSPCN